MHSTSLGIILLALLSGCAALTAPSATRVPLPITATTVPYELLPDAPEPKQVIEANPFGRQGPATSETAFLDALQNYEICMGIHGSALAIQHKALLIDASETTRARIISSPEADKARSSAAGYCDSSRQEAAQFGRLKWADPRHKDGLLGFGYHSFDEGFSGKAAYYAYPPCPSSENDPQPSLPGFPTPRQCRSE